MHKPATEKIKKRIPARIPPQTPPAGGKRAEAKRKILSPRKIDFRFAESVLKPHALPEYLEGRTPKEKHPFLFQKKFHPRQIRNARSVFLSGLPRLCEAVAERYERTRQFRATTRSARAISRHQDYQQNTFELCLIHTATKRNRARKQKYGRREAPSVLHSPPL